MKVFRPKMDVIGAGDARALLAPAEQFRLWLQAARAGEQIVYACATWLPQKTGGNHVRQIVQEAYDAGEIRLFQRRLPAPPEGPGGFEYIAERRARVLRPAVRFLPRDGGGRVWK